MSDEVKVGDRFRHGVTGSEWEVLDVVGDRCTVSGGMPTDVTPYAMSGMLISGLRRSYTHIPREEKPTAEVKPLCHLEAAGDKRPVCGAQEWHIFQMTDERDEVTCERCQAVMGTHCARAGHTLKDGVVELCGPECEYRKAEPAKALPFRYMPDADDIGNSPYRCPDSAKHDGTMCVTCEGIIAKMMQSGDADMVKTREAARKVERPAYEPLHGAFVGRVLTPVRR